MKIEVKDDPNSHSFKLDLLLDVDSDDVITCVSSYDANIYVGTSSGRVLHYHRFEDIPGYMLIGNVQILEEPIKKFVIIPAVEKVLILCGSIASFYRLPDLSPTSTRKLKDINDVSLLMYSSEQNRPSDKMLLFSSNNIRIVQFDEEQIKLLKKINYSNAIKGISTTSTMSTNFSNLVLVANTKNYDIIDMRLTRKIPLFDYRSDDDDDKIEPNFIQFEARDRGSTFQEYLLTINSGDNTSLAMFINSLGDVTRGTLTWSGYPVGGIAVEWPYVMSIFPNNELQVSSLITLDTKATLDLTQLHSTSSTFKIDKTSTISVECSTLTSILRTCSFKENSIGPGDVINDLGNLVIFSGSKLWLMFPENDILQTYDSWLELLDEGNLDSIVETIRKKIDKSTGRIKSFMIHMLVLCLFQLEKFNEAKKYLFSTSEMKPIIDPCLVVYLFGYSYDDLDFKLFSGIKDNINRFKIIKNDKFLLTYIKGAYPVLSNSQILRRTFVKLLNSDDEVIDFFEGKDINNWSSLNKANQEIIDILEEKKFNDATIHIYRKLLEVKPDEDLAVKVCNLILNVMSGQENSFHLVDIILENLPIISSENNYSSLLFEVLKVDKDKGINYMKSNNKSKFKAIHNEIMSDISSKYGDALDFSLLRIEFLEASLSSENLDELLNEVLRLLLSPLILNENNINNFEILIETYRILNSLQDPKWPKISWLDYLHIRINSSGCNDLIILYLKFFELLLIKTNLGKDITEFLKDELLEGKTFSYFNVLKPDVDVINHLLSHSDFSAAEVFAINGRLPYPKIKSYPKLTEESKINKSTSSIKLNLITIFDYYLKENTTDSANEFSVAHFISNYGSTYFTPNEIVSKLPSDIPLVHLLDYFSSVIIEFNLESRKKILQKSLTKADSEFTRQIYRQFLEEGTN
ncbi:hypothetical protein DFJ63DRAFT_315142 [Scheffersomyces coipomensis]|uniref:uncharacterized protein n=1 Tax=Scheffersomyces coipomensis TaxID=1788519 RepID=UPI00315DD7B1